MSVKGVKTIDVDQQLLQIVGLFKTGKEKEALAQFSTIPQGVQNYIFLLLGWKSIPQSTFVLAAAETGYYAFYNMNDKTTLKVKDKIQAILQYLSEPKSK